MKAGFAILIAALLTQAPDPQAWLLPNFAERLELEAVNPSPEPVRALAVVPVQQASPAALRFPGTLAIVVSPGAENAILPSQVDDLDGNGTPDELLFPIELGPREARRIHAYYSTTLRDSIPWPKRVHASHAFGYNRATAALESERIGYRTYGGFFLDVQARLAARPGLNNSLLGYFGSRNPSPAGLDVVHLGDTLGLGGLFLRAGERVWRPPLNVPDYVHRPSPPEVPEYRVVASGPLRAVVEAKMERWSIGEDAVAVRATYAIAAGQTHVECRFRIVPLRLSRGYDVGAGIRHLPEMTLDRVPGRLALSGRQSPGTGPLALAIFYDTADAVASDPIPTPDSPNEAIVFKDQLRPGRALSGRYWMAAAWSGSGDGEPLLHLVRVEKEARGSVRVENLRLAKTPIPERLEGEAR